MGGSGAQSFARTGADAKLGDPVAIHFTLATPDGQEHFRTQAQIARFLDGDTGIGVKFTEALDETMLNALVDFSRASGVMAQPAPATESEAVTAPDAMGDGEDSDPNLTTEIPETLLRDKRVSEADAERIRKRVRRLTEQGLTRIAKVCLDKVTEVLLSKARDAGTNAVQTMYFEGLDQIEKKGNEIGHAFIQDILEQITQVSEIESVLERRRRREMGETDKLELVDTDEFEDWLAIAEIISKTENRFSDILFELRMRLGLLAKPWGHKDVIPVGPAAMCWAFDGALSAIDLRRAVKSDVLDCYEQALVPVLDNFYGALNKMLEDSGIFPTIEDVRSSIRKAEQRANPPPQEPDDYQEMEPALREAAMSADGLGSVGTVGYNPYEQPQRTQVYNSARELLGLSRLTRTTNEPLPGLAPEDATEDERYDSGDILDALSVIEQELGDAPLTDVRLKPRLLEVLEHRHGDTKGLGEDDYDLFDIVENLVDAIQLDPLVTDGVRNWVKRLELTFNKLAMKDPQFLKQSEGDAHSAMEMLNQLARLGNASDVRQGIDRDIGETVDELMERVLTEYDGNPKVFGEVVSELNPLVDRLNRTYRSNIERTVKQSEGQQRLGRARLAVLNEVGERLGGKEVPDLTMQLLTPGWRNLLIHTYLRHGPESNEWKDQLSLLDSVDGQLRGEVNEGDPDFVDPDKLLKRVADGLSDISFDPAKRTPLIMRLSDTLVGDTTGERVPASSSYVGDEEVAGALELEGLLPEIDPRIETDDDGVRKDWNTALERVRKMRVGEWLATGDKQGRPLILTVAFIGDRHSNFVLVNRKGLKNQELTLEEMATGVYEGRITLLDDFDIPLMERASQRMLQNMHNQLAYQASHDDLTDLMNRREFERQLDASIQRAKAQASQHVLLYLDMDQFKIVNNTSGHAAGDALLKHLSARISEAIAPHDGDVARLGGDEFGVLVENVETQGARDLAAEMVSLVRDQRFDWEGRFYSLSVSIGLVFIDETTPSADAALGYADEACYAAKDGGRNRVQEYELGDRNVMQRHGVMEWVTQLDKAMDEDRLVLNCQRIAPVSPNGDGGIDTHYEILLTMRDEFGDPMPPSEFILAAETYNRVIDVDRWVIENVLDWMTANRTLLDNINGFSINISGHSINDETFADFVLDQFSKSQAPTSKVTFEITETAAIANLDNAVEFMNRMKIIGCRFSLDDFGTGLSSYSYLRTLPVDYVKIDGVFVKDLHNNQGDYAVVRSINEIGHYMGKKTIAEYVENDEILCELREIGVDYAQGYVIEKPKPLDELVTV